MSDEPKQRLIALLSGPDCRGIVARLSGWLFERGGNIIHADQHRDREEGIFFQRIEWDSASEDLEAEADAFRRYAAELGMGAHVALPDHLPAFAILVSRSPHCFHDLVLRWQAGEFRCRIACVISNHESVRRDCEHYGLPFHHVPVSRENKDAAEGRQLAILKREKVDFVVMARYMQVLSESFLDRVGCPVINIHHSFLPAFVGAKPYHQAYARGVKLIGATAHYATAVLDDGPIIHQDVVRVSHRHGVADLIRKGRDLEKIVLSQAVAWQLEHRILVYGRKTVVFD